MTHNQRVELALQFILCQTTLEDCHKHEQIQHQLRACGMELRKDAGGYWVFCGGERYTVRCLMDLVRLLR